MQDLKVKILMCKFLYLKKISIHTSKSMYFEFPINDQIIVTTFNFENKNICIYSRFNKEISNVEKILSFLNFTKNDNKHSLYSSLRDDKNFHITIIKIANKFEEFNIRNQKINLKNENYNDILGNKIINFKKNKLENLNVTFKGKNNRLTILESSNLKNINIDFQLNNSEIIIGNNPRLKFDIKVGENCKINIGQNITSTGKLYITAAESSKITIKDDCMFATNNQIRTDDAHPIYDSITGNRINFSKDVFINNHVWVAYGASLFGGANIGQGSIIGAFSFVKSKFPNNCIIAGVPAKILKKNVFWDRKSLVSSSIKPEKYPTHLLIKNYIDITHEEF